MTATAARTFAHAYAAAFSAFVAEPGETALRSAYELGRDALVKELSLLDLATAHHEALLAETRRAADQAGKEHVTELAADFLAESLSAYEMAWRGFGEVAGAAAAERRQAALVRSLSSLLTDPSLALQGEASVEEMLRLVAEQACELCEAASCVVTVHAIRARQPISIRVHASDDDHEPEADEPDLDDLRARHTATRVAGGVARSAGGEEPHGAWLGVRLAALDGTELGFIDLLGEPGRPTFDDVEVALVVHLAQMTSAALERAAHYAPSRGSG